jgi:hypothetical protein
MRATADKAGIHSRMVLKGNLQHTIKGTGKIYLRERSRGQCSSELPPNGKGLGKV